MKIPINEQEAKELFKNLYHNNDNLSARALAISQKSFGKKLVSMP